MDSLIRKRENRQTPPALIGECERFLSHSMKGHHAIFSEVLWHRGSYGVTGRRMINLVPGRMSTPAINGIWPHIANGDFGRTSAVRRSRSP